jgi:ketosteroid isomerase-like protein
VALCKWLLTLRLSGRLDELMEHFTPDCELHIAGGSNLSPYAGRYHGRDAVKAKLRSLHTSIEHLEFEPLSFVIDGDDVAIRWRSRGRNRGAGPAKWLEGMTLLKFRNDLVAYYGNFLDTAMMADLTGWPAPSQD